MIWSFRYRGSVREGVQTRHVEAATLLEADTIAQTWVSRRPGALFIPNSVEPWLISLEQLPVAPVPEPEKVKADAPTLGEQKERLKTQGAARAAGTGVGSQPRQEGRIGA